MGTMDATMTTGHYTEELLSKNFTNIANGFTSLESMVLHMNDHMSELYSIVAALQKKPQGLPTKYKILIGVGIGVYIGRSMMKEDFNRKMAQVRKEAKEQFDSFVADSRNQKEPSSEESATAGV